MKVRSEDPVLVSARREALVVLVIWLTAMTWTVGYSYLYGYHRELSSLKFVLGFPDWIFWGVIVPWCTCGATSFLFGAVFMRNEDLGEDMPAADDEGGSSHA